jgi:6-phosphogluconolactonase
METDVLVFIGTYTEPIRFGTGNILEGKGEGIYVYRLALDSGALRYVTKITGIVNPSYLTLDQAGRCVYAVNEMKVYDGMPTGTVSAFRLNTQKGELQFLNKQVTQGTDPCHVVLEQRGRFAFVANFMSGSVCVFPVEADGRLGEAVEFIQHEGSSIDPIRQKGPHAHSVTLDPTNRLALVPDLGLDRLIVYRFDPERGTLRPHKVPWHATKPGAGPRHVAFHPSGRWGFLVNELDCTIMAFAYDRKQGLFTEKQIVSTLPAGFAGDNTCADIQITPSGHFLYASNRGHDSLVIYRIDQQTGGLNYVGHTPSGGKTPRNFGIDPTGQFLLAANQDTDAIVTFRIDQQTGDLIPTGHATDVPTPVCVKFLRTGNT